MDEEKKLKINGDHFTKVLTKEIQELNIVLKIQLANIKGRARRSPLLNLYESGRLNIEFVLKEMPKLNNKTSDLPTGERTVLKGIIEKAIKQTVLEEEEEKAEKEKPKKKTTKAKAKKE